MVLAGCAISERNERMTNNLHQLRAPAETTTRDLALAIGVPHSRLLAKIKGLDGVCSREFYTQSFWPSTYTDKQGKTRPQFKLTRNGFLFLVMSFNTLKSRALMMTFLEEFNKAEQTALSYGLHSRPFEIDDFIK
jgi:Rha family phage regulatory protein